MRGDHDEAAVSTAIVAVVIAAVVVVGGVGAYVVFVVPGSGQGQPTQTGGTTQSTTQTGFTTSSTYVTTSTSSPSSQGTKTTTTAQTTQSTAPPPTTQSSETSTQETSSTATTSETSATSETTTSEYSTTTMECTSTSATSSGSFDYNMAPLLDAFSAMSVTNTQIVSGSTYTMQYTYQVTATSGSGQDKIYTVVTTGGYVSSSAVTFQYRADGTVISAEVNGVDMTPAALTYWTSAMAPYIFELMFLQDPSMYTSMLPIHSTGQESVTLGPTTMTVTDYEMNSLPYTYVICGSSITISAFDLKAGKVPQNSASLLVLYHFAEQASSGGQSAEVDMTMQVTSVAV